MCADLLSPLLPLPTLLFEIGCFNEPDAHQLAYILASQQALGTSLAPTPPSSDGTTGMLCLRWLFTGKAEIRSSWLHSRHFTHPVTLLVSGLCALHAHWVCSTGHSRQGTMSNINCGKAASASQVEEELYKPGIICVLTETRMKKNPWVPATRSQATLSGPNY